MKRKNFPGRILRRLRVAEVARTRDLSEVNERIARGAWHPKHYRTGWSEAMMCELTVSLSALHEHELRAIRTRIGALESATA